MFESRKTLLELVVYRKKWDQRYIFCYTLELCAEHYGELNKTKNIMCGYCY
jgi:hypothetical protein